MKLINHAGRRVGILTVTAEFERRKHLVFWKCICDCGVEKFIVAHVVANDAIKSCGCRNLAKDLVGQRFGHWEVIDRVQQEGRGTQRFVCKCDCGTVKTVRRRELNAGLSRSCGCRLFLKDGLAAMRAVMITYKRSAEARNYVWDLTEKLFHEITQRNCHYCGIEPKQTQKTSTKSRYIYNGIDRVNSRMGYTPDNVVACCKACNFAKHTMSIEDFMTWVRRIYTHSLMLEDAFAA